MNPLNNGNIVLMTYESCAKKEELGSLRNTKHPDVFFLSKQDFTVSNLVDHLVVDLWLTDRT